MPGWPLGCQGVHFSIFPFLYKVLTDTLRTAQSAVFNHVEVRGSAQTRSLLLPDDEILSYTLGRIRASAIGPKLSDGILRLVPKLGGLETRDSARQHTWGSSGTPQPHRPREHTREDTPKPAHPTPRKLTDRQHAKQRQRRPSRGQGPGTSVFRGALATRITALKPTTADPPQAVPLAGAGKTDTGYVPCTGT